MNRKLRTGAVICAAVVATVVVSACDESHPQSSGQKLENQQQSQSTTSLVMNQPLPHFSWSQLRQNLKEIETAQANGVQTMTFFFNQGVQDPIFSCPSIGAPIPTTAQLSNPNQVVHDSYPSGGAALTTGQMDPTGIYAGDSSGTYVMCVNAAGKPYATYWEGYVQTVFGNATWDKAKHTMMMDGDPSFDFSKGR